MTVNFKNPAPRNPHPHSQRLVEQTHRRAHPAALSLWLLAAGVAAASTPLSGAEAGKIPVIYCTDLFHPHDDPDDHFDLAAIYAIPELDLKCIILDQGEKQLAQPGRVPVSQMNHLTGRRVPAVSGLARQLKNPTDTALDQPSEFQQGVKRILAILKDSTGPVMIATVGSVRDVVAAFNREPALVREKLGKLLVFIGEASEPGFQEYNVGLDPQAYVGLMRSGLPVYWVPCFDGGVWQNRGHASFWQAGHRDLLRDAPDPLLQYFIYALDKEQSEPLAFLNQRPDPQRKARLLAGTRNLWCTAIFGTLAERIVVSDRERYLLPPPSRFDARSLTSGTPLFRFSAVSLSITDDAVIEYGATAGARQVMRFEVLDPAHYAEGMTTVTARLLSNLPSPR